MANTTSSDLVSAGVMKVLPMGYKQSILGTAAATTTNAYANDLFNMVKLEANPSAYEANKAGGPTITGVEIGSDDLDSGSLITFDVGDSGSAARFISATTIPRTGGNFKGTLSPCMGYQPFASPIFATYTTVSLATYLMQVKVNASAGTAVAGNIRLLVDFTIDS